MCETKKLLKDAFMMQADKFVQIMNYPNKPILPFGLAVIFVALAIRQLWTIIAVGGDGVAENLGD